LENAGLEGFCEKQFKLHLATAYTPVPRYYQMGADTKGLSPEYCCMVATPVWDTIRAPAAGLSAGLLTRPGNAPLLIPGLPQPNVTGKDLPGLAKEMNRLWPQEQTA